MQVTLKRERSTDQGTFGLLSFGDWSTRTIELPWRENARRISCIPVGRYECSLVNSPRFGRVYGVRDVYGRSNILIHSANLAGDVMRGFDTHLQGCIAPVLYKGAMINTRGVMQDAGLASAPALRRLTDWAKGKPFILEVL
jgi:Family of unknown function (DUF5675)